MNQIRHSEYILYERCSLLILRFGVLLNKFQRISWKDLMIYHIFYITASIWKSSGYHHSAYIYTFDYHSVLHTLVCNQLYNLNSALTI